MAYRYTYVDLLNVIRDVDDTQLNYAGPWNSSTQYFPFDVVLYNSTRYVCLAPTLGDVPTVVQVRDDHWSALVFVSTGSSAGEAAVEAYSIATEALRIAIIGTNLGQQAYTIGITALYTAWSGTDLAQQAYDLALLALQSGGTGSSGTVGQEAYALALQALHTAWVGTLAGDQAYNVAMDAYRLAVQGTNASAFDVDTILTTVDGNIVVNSSGNVVVSGGY